MAIVEEAATARTRTVPALDSVRRLDRRWWLVAVALAAVAFAATLVATRSGPAVSPDSADYLSIAHNLAHGRGIVDWTREPEAVFPPAYPAVLAFGETLGVDGLTTARYTNAVAFALIVVLAFALLGRHVSSPWLVLAGTGIITLSPGLLDIADHVWSDPLFIVCVLGFLLLLEDALERAPADTRALIGAALVVWPAFLLRYAAFALPVTGAIALAWVLRRARLRVVVQRVGLFAGVAAVVPVAWLIRNVVDVGELLGPRLDSTSSATVRALAEDTVDGIGRLVLPAATTQAERAVFVIVLVVAGVAAWLWTRRRPTLGVPRRTYLALTGFLVVYLAIALLSEKLTGSDVEERVLSPMVVPGVVVLISLFERVWRTAPARARASVGVALGATLLGCLLATGIWFTRDADNNGAIPRSLASPYFTNSELARAVRDVDRKALIVSDLPGVISFVSRREPVLYGFAQEVPGLSHRPEHADELARTACTHDLYGAFFTLVSGGKTPYESTPGLRRYFELTTIRDYPEGPLLRFALTPAGKARCPLTDR